MGCWLGTKKPATKQASASCNAFAANITQILDIHYLSILRAKLDQAADKVFVSTNSIAKRIRRVGLYYMTRQLWKRGAHRHNNAYNRPNTCRNRNCAPVSKLLFYQHPPKLNIFLLPWLVLPRRSDPPGCILHLLETSCDHCLIKNFHAYRMEEHYQGKAIARQRVTDPFPAWHP